MYRLRRLAGDPTGKLEVKPTVNPFTGRETNADLDFDAVNFRTKTIQCAELASHMQRDSLMLVLGRTYVQTGGDIVTVNIRVHGGSVSYDSEDEYEDSGDESEVVTEDVLPVRSLLRWREKQHN